MDNGDFSFSDDEGSDYGVELGIEEDSQQVHNADNEAEEDVAIIIKQENLVDEMNQKVMKLSLLEISPSVCKPLLNKFGWDANKIVEQFYDSESPASFFKKVKIDVPASTSRNFVIKDGDVCFICFCDNQPLIALDCHHFFCGECWNSHLLTQFRAVGNPYATCPNTDCNYYIDEASVLKLLKCPMEKEFYERLMVNAFVDSNPLMRWCPGIHCTQVIKVKKSGCRAVTCDCGTTFCFKCSQEWHEPLTCELLAKWIKKYSGDSETMKWVSVNTKDCPKCTAAIEKNGGCNHMQCRNKSCNYEFCWLCMQDWKVHGYNAGCGRYQEPSAAADQASVFREKLQRYLHYYDRFANHRKSLQAESKLMEQIMIKISQMQAVNYSWIETQFLRDAVKTLNKCRQSLMFAYPFAYYLPPSNNKYIFEDNQQDLEHATEQLSHLLEQELDLESVDLVQLKQSVQDRARYVTDRRQKMIQHCTEGIERGEWTFNTEE